MAYGKDMSKVYFRMNNMQLRELRAKKVRMMQRAEQFNTFFARRDRELLSHQIMQIDAVLESRAAQPRLFD
jgi:hypothetical protein